MKEELYICDCGKKCSSKAGITMHSMYCKSKNYKTVVVEPAKVVETMHPELRELFLLTQNLFYDANEAMVNGNRAAGRRARVKLIKIKKLIPPIRKLILNRTV